MQRQTYAEEESPALTRAYDLALDEVRIEGVAKNAMPHLRRWVLALACITYTVMILVFALIRGHVPPLFLAVTTIAVVFLAAMLWVQTTLMAKYWPQQHKPTLTLGPDGLTVSAIVSGTCQIPWEEIGEIRGASMLGLPLVAIKDRDGKIRRRLGGRYWMYWWPGGIGLNALTFGYSGKALAEKIRAYRDAAISG
jgi:hypothetical protein